mgnify:FL=1
MADWSRIQHQVDALIGGVSATRSDQSLWTWREMVRHLVQDFRETGTQRTSAYTLFGGTDDVDVEAGAIRLFGAVIDNSMAAEDAYIALYNTATVVEGTTDTLGYLWAPRNRVVAYAFRPIVFATAFSWSSVLGTEAGLEAGTLTTASGTQVGFIYSE